MRQTATKPGRKSKNNKLEIRQGNQQAAKMKSGAVVFFLFFLFLASVGLAGAHIDVYDDYWRQKAEAAQARADAIYYRDPQAVSDALHDEVTESLVRNSTGTRRGLRGRRYNGPCMATNPIDRCWRCSATWATPATNRKRLARCVKGFGRHTTGGLLGDIYVVTDAADDSLDNPRYGTLRWGVTRDSPLWITFARSMIIRLNEELIINNDKTIDGRGANVHIAFGAGLTIQFVNNVIVHNIHIHDISPSGGGMIRSSETHVGFRTKSDGDGISLFGATNVWIDHVSMSNCGDGLIDVIETSTGITISNGHYAAHNDVMLFGARDSNENDTKMQVTVAFNNFGRGLTQRMPRCRFGFVHVLNNDYTHWLMYAIGGSQHPTIISQGNRFTAPPNQFAKQVTKRDYATEDTWKKWTWTSEGDMMREGAFFIPSGGPNRRMFNKNDFIKFRPGNYVPRLTRFSGTLSCRVGKPC